MNFEQYILRLNLDDIVRQVDEATEAYTDLGKSIRSSVNQSTENFGDLHKTISGVNSEIGRMDPIINKSIRDVDRSISGATKGLVTLSEQSVKIAQQLKELKASKVSGVNPSVMQSQKQLRDMSEQAGELDATSKAVSDRSGQAQKQMSAGMKDVEKQAGFIESSVKSEIRGAKNQVNGILNKVTGGVFSSGTIMGSLFSAMILGYTEKDRLKMWIVFFSILSMTLVGELPP